MHASIVHHLELFKFDALILILVKSLESSFNEGPSELAHFTDDNPEELVEADLTSAIDVDGFEKTLNVLLVNIHTKVINSIRELFKIEHARAIIVSNFELSCKAHDASSTTVLEGLSESLDQNSLELWHWGFGSDLEAWIKLGVLGLTLIIHHWLSCVVTFF
jgi:hypothetical protein